MARCPFCDAVLPDPWIKREGASLMGKTAKGKRKQRSAAAQAALARWDRQKKKRKKKM